MPAVTGYLISVPQADGEIHIAANGDGRRVYPVTDGQISVAPEDVGLVLANVAGASLVEAPATKTSAPVDAAKRSA